MSKQTIFIGSSANDHTGDTLRVAFDKVNDNFTELYTSTGVQIPLQTGNAGKYLSTDGSTLSWQTVSGGTADTGNVTFDDITVQGVYGLRLSPSTADTATGKYLQVRAGDNDSHIHFDSGDNSTYDVILGDDSKYVRVDHAGQVVVGASGPTWTYGTDGTFSAPGNVIIGGASSSSESHLVVDGANYWTSMQWINFPPQPSTATPFECQSQLLRVFKGKAWMDNPGDGGHEEMVAISAIRDNFTLNGLMFTTSDDKIPDAPYNDGVGTMYTWILGGNGTVQFPNMPTNNRTGSADALVFAKRDAVQKSIATQSGTVTYPTVERLVIAGGDSYNDGSNYIGEGGDIYLWAGYGNDGGDIKVDAGNGVNSGGSVKVRGGNATSAGNGGFVEITSGYSSAGDAGNITINAANAEANGGSVNIYSGTGNTSSGNVTISTPGNTWTFGTDGSLQIPYSITNTSRIESNLSTETGSLYPNIRSWDSVGEYNGNPLYVWINASDTPEIQALNAEEDLTGWKVLDSDGNRVNIVDVNPAGWFSFTTDSPLFTPPLSIFPSYYSPGGFVAELKLNVTEGADYPYNNNNKSVELSIHNNDYSTLYTWKFNNNGDFIIPDGSNILYTNGESVFSGSDRLVRPNGDKIVLTSEGLQFDPYYISGVTTISPYYIESTDTIGSDNYHYAVGSYWSLPPYYSNPMYDTYASKLWVETDAPNAYAGNSNYVICEDEMTGIGIHNITTKTRYANRNGNSPYIPGFAIYADKGWQFNGNGEFVLPSYGNLSKILSADGTNVGPFLEFSIDSGDWINNFSPNYCTWSGTTITIAFSESSYGKNLLDGLLLLQAGDGIVINGKQLTSIVTTMQLDESIPYPGYNTYTIEVADSCLYPEWANTNSWAIYLIGYIHRGFASRSVIINQGSKYWQFAQNGGLIFPDNTTQTTAYVTGQTNVTLNLSTENMMAGYTVANLNNSVIFFTPQVGYENVTTHVGSIPSPTVPGQKLTLISDYSGSVAVAWTWGESTNSITLNPYENSELTAINHPSQGLVWWETNRYSW